MSVRVIAKVWPVPLSAVDKIILLKLADSADDAGQNAYPSVRRLVRECGVGERTAREALRRLRDGGYIHETAPANFGAKIPTVYRLDMQKIEAATPAADAGVSTPAPAAPLRQPPPTPAADAGVPLRQPHPDPSSYPSLNRPKRVVDVASAMIAIWCEELGDVLSKPRDLTDSRTRAASRRLKDQYGGDLEAWRGFCQLIRSKPFLLGAGQRGWKADIDWALRPNSRTLTEEGKYDRYGGAGSNGARPHGRTRETAADVYQEFQDGEAFDAE